MLLKVSYGQKQGRPEYSSEQAGVEITLDVSEKTVSESPASLVDEIRRAFQLCRDEVLHQLDQHQVEHQHQHQPDPPAAPARDRLPSQARAPSEPEPDRPRRGGYEPKQGSDPSSKPHNGFPRSGRELVPWAKKREESGEFPNLWKRLVGYGVAQDFPGRVVEWSRDEVTEAVRAVLGAQYDDDPEPAQNGHSNGYGGRNGNGRSY
jgi:hypothetical protein